MKPIFSRIRVTVIDGVGCGEAENRREDYKEDVGVNSLLNVSKIVSLNTPNLLSMGLEKIEGLERLKAISKQKEVKGAFGRLTPTFAGNDSLEGHQALMGNLVSSSYLFFDKSGILPEIIEIVKKSCEEITGRKVEILRYPGTDNVSGTIFINAPGIGDRHLQSGKEGILFVPIYSSTDSVIQIALHEGIVPQNQVEEIGKLVRIGLDNAKIRAARVIMRPFRGGPNPGKFERISEYRRDYVMDPDKKMLPEFLEEAGVNNFGVGKAASMLNYKGFNILNIRKPGSDEEKMKIISSDYDSDSEDLRFDFDNLVGTDELWGHRRNPKGYAMHLEMIDRYVGQVMEKITENDLWIITSDHGNDPTQKLHTNHTNEYVPILIYSPKIINAINLGTRKSYCDVAKTIAENFGIAEKITEGESFLKDLI